MKPVKKIKIKYYSKEIVKYLLLTGMVTVAASSPYFTLNIIKNISKRKDFSAKEKKKITSCFYYLKKQGLIEIKRDGHDLSILLTEKGKKRAGKYQINDLTLQKPKKWDKKWRIIIFDVPNVQNMIRDIFRRKLKEFGFVCIQKSVWIYPFPCEEEVNFLREFLGVDKKQVQIFEAVKIENEKHLKKIFNL